MEKMEPNSRSHLIRKAIEPINERLNGSICQEVAQTRLYSWPMQGHDADHTYSLCLRDTIPSNIKKQMQLRTDRYSSLQGRVRHS